MAGFRFLKLRKRNANQFFDLAGQISLALKEEISNSLETQLL